MTDPSQTGEPDPVIRGLIRRLEAGDLSAGERLIKRFQDRVLRFFLRRGCNYHDARDLTQESFISVIKSIRSFDPHESPLEAWLTGICQNKYRTWARTTVRTADREIEYSVSLDITSQEDVPSDSVLEQQEETASQVSRLEAYIADLPPRLRVVMDFTAKGMSPNEIAEVIGVRAPAVRRRLRIASKKIRAAFERDQGEES